MVNNVGVFQLAGSVSFLSLVMLNLNRNSNTNKTITCYKAIIQFWRHTIAIKVRATLIKTCANLQIYSFVFADKDSNVVLQILSQP